jgi:23S rRNA (cytosine1962-C5)-methyltransferase
MNNGQWTMDNGQGADPPSRRTMTGSEEDAMIDSFGPTARRILRLRQGRDRLIVNRHPWIFTGAIDREEGPDEAAIGDLVDARGARLASGFYSRHSQIRLRALTFGEEELTADVIRTRIRAAFARRVHLLTPETNAVRLVHSEGDELSGLVVDRYDDMIVIEITSAGAERISDLIVETIRQEVAPRVILRSNDLPSRKHEKLSLESRLEGAPPARATIRENGLTFLVDAEEGQKTGFFLDQRDNRALLRTVVAGRRVLNLFSYSGAFGVYAAAGGASAVTNVDISAGAVALARQNHDLNGSAGVATFEVADAFSYLRGAGRQEWDVVVCDPPAFAKSRSDIDRAARGYKDVNLHALRQLVPGGLLMTFSCSGHISLDLFQKILFGAAVDAGRRVSIVRRLTAGEDHPTSLFCPEGEYLKGLLLQVH